MADTYQPNSAAALTIAGGQPAFVEDQFLTPNAAARFDIVGGQPKFVQGQAYHLIEAARLDILAVQPTFRFMTHYIPHEAAQFRLEAAQPSYEMGEGALEYRPEAAALLSITGAQPVFNMRTPESLTFTPLRAARLNFIGGQPYFVGGDLIAAAPPPLLFKWDGTSPLEESYNYAVSISAFDNLNEQRRKLGSQPGGTIRFRMGHLSAAEAQAAKAFLVFAQGGKILVPLWQYETRIAQAIPQGDIIAWAELTGVPLQSQMFAMVWRSHSDNQVNIIADADASGAILAYPAKKLWPAGTSLVPMAIGRLTPDESFMFQDLDLATQEIEVAIERWIA